MSCISAIFHGFKKTTAAHVLIMLMDSRAASKFNVDKVHKTSIVAQVEQHSGPGFACHVMEKADQNT